LNGAGQYGDSHAFRSRSSIMTSLLVFACSRHCVQTYTIRATQGREQITCERFPHTAGLENKNMSKLRYFLSHFGCNSVQSGTSLPTFRRNSLPPFSSKQSRVLKMEDICSSETSVDFQRLHVVVSQKTVLFTTIGVRTSNPTSQKQTELA
jgi:hypothetical protein